MIPDGAIAVLDHGYVALTAVMGDDRTAARTARTSFATRHDKTEEQDARLTHYLVSHGHNTPLEFCQLRFYLKLPIFVARQMVRHRTASINEISLRYVEADGDFYIPAVERCQKQSEKNKQGSSDELVADPAFVFNTIADTSLASWDVYQDLLKCGLAKELARIVLPVNFYTEWYWQIDLHNLIHFLKLRTDEHAQWEIRQYALAMAELTRPHFPTSLSAAGF